MIGAALRVLPVMAALAGGISGDGLVSAAVPAGMAHAHWIEVSWPFPMDQWGAPAGHSCARPMPAA